MKVLRLLPLLALIGGCTRDNGTILCVPGQQQACTCPGGTTGAQVCNAEGNGFDQCFGCPGGPSSPDLLGTDPNADLAVPPGSDLAVPPGSDLAVPPGSDLAVPPGSDLAVPPGSDLAVPPGSDLSVPPADLANPLADLKGADLVGTGGTPCAVVMIIIDRSGSMGDPISGNFGDTGPTKLEAARAAVMKMVANYGGRVPFGLTAFDNSNFNDCSTGVDILVEPALGTAGAIETQSGTIMLGGSTNTGVAIDKVAADPNMHQAGRVGSFNILLTDGDPNCAPATDGGLQDPNFTFVEIGRAASQDGIKTFVVGLGALDATVQGNLDSMAQAGLAQCAGAPCQGKKYYPANSQAMLDTALDLIAQKIVSGAPGGSCGDFQCFPSGAACSGGKTCCGSTGCSSLNDTTNCGECGNVCAGTGAVCSTGKCLCGGVECGAGDSCCNGTCCSKIDMTPPPDLRPPPVQDMTAHSCSCTKTCLQGCLQGCCLEDVITGGCTPDPNCTN
jgi:hypothetical protein